MPKIKTHSGAKKRFKTTKSGKVKRNQQSVREIFVSRLLPMLQTRSNARDLFLTNNLSF